jgi:hypothetical protein
MTTTITREEWLKALQDAEGPIEPADPDVLTVRELQTVFGVGRSATQERIARLMAAGKARATTKQLRASDGRMRIVPAYRLVRDGNNH